MSSSNIDNEVIDGASFDDLIKNNKCGKVYVMLGINEVGNDFQFTLTKYRAIIERLKTHQPDAIIYIQANLHVASYSESNVINNANINYLNSLFASLADNKKVFYIDINELYDDENGALTAAYTSDGVHPLAAYYKQWCEWLCQNTIITNQVTEPTTADPNYYPVTPPATDAAQAAVQ
jgi:lysophospholipase L1-like esterase